MDMDFHGMKRKRLQALCKKHGIPANLKNNEMADRLSSIFKGKEIEDPVCSGNVGTKKDTPCCVGGKDMNVEMIDLVTPSPGLEERSVFSAKNLKGSEIERLEFETNLSPEITRGGFGICEVEEDMKSVLNEEQVVDSQGGFDSAPVVVALEESNNILVEAEVEKLSEKNNLLEDVCENGKGRDEALEQGDNNSPQGSNMKYVSVLLVSQEKSGYPMTEDDEAAEKGDHSSLQASNMKGVNVLHVSQEESGYPMVEEDGNLEHGSHNSPLESKIKDVNDLHVSQEESPVVEEDEAAEQGDHNSPQGPNVKDMTVLHQEYAYPMVEDDEVAEQGNHNSPQGSNMRDMNVLHVSQEESVYPMVEDEEEVAVEQSNHSSPKGSNMKDENALHVSPEESGHPMVEEKEGAVEQGDHHSTQGSPMKDANVLHVSQEESCYPMVDEVQKSDDNIHSGSVCNLINCGSEVAVKDTDGKTNLTAEHVADDVPSGLNKYSVGTPDQFQRTYPENEVNSSGLNIHQDAFDGELKTPQKTGPIADPRECVGFSPKNLETSAINGFQAETYFGRSTLGDVEGTFNMKERTQSIKMDEVKHFIDEQVIHSASSVMVLNNDDLLQVASVEVGDHLLEGEVEKTGLITGSEEAYIGICDVENMQNDVNEEQVDDSQQVMHAASSVMDLNNEVFIQVASVEVGDDLLEEEVEKSGLLADSEECIGFMFSNLEPSATKGFQAETYLDSSTLGDVLGTCNMEESMQSDQMEKEYSQEVLNMANELERSMEESDPMEGEVIRLFDNSDDHEDAGETEAEDKSQNYMKSDIDRIEKYLLNDFQSIDDVVAQNSDEYAPTVPQSVEMKPCTFNLQQISASDTVSGDEVSVQEGIETPTKCILIPSSEDNTIFSSNLVSSLKKELIVKSLPVKRAKDVLGASDMKENIKIAKKEQVGTIISRSAFPKRKPLQDLQQN